MDLGVGCLRKQKLEARIAYIHQMADFEGPVPKPAQLVQLLNSQGPKLETVRLLAPAHFRCHIAGVDTLNTPVSVIFEWSKLLGVSVAKLTGGNWQKLAHPKGQLLLAHLRLPQDLAGKIWCWLLEETKVGGSNCFSSSLLNL